MAKLITVFGATGQQGGSLIEHILSDDILSKEWKVRGITRNGSGQVARALKGKGVDIVQADLNDPESLKAAVAGTYALFGVTNFWEAREKSVEVSQGKAIADAAVAAGVQLLIWSSLPSMTKMTNGEIDYLHHFDSKAEVEEYIRSLPIIGCFFMPAWYMQNFQNPLTPDPKINDDGSILFPYPWSPDARIPLIDIRDIGKYLAPVLNNPAKFAGKRLTAATMFYRAQDIVDIWSKVTGKTVTLSSTGDILKHSGSSDIPHEKFLSLLNKFRYYGPTGPDDLEWTLSQLEKDVNLNTWKEFVIENKEWYTNPQKVHSPT